MCECALWVLVCIHALFCCPPIVRDVCAWAASGLNVMQVLRKCGCDKCVALLCTRALVGVKSMIVGCFVPLCHVRVGGACVEMCLRGSRACRGSLPGEACVLDMHWSTHTCDSASCTPYSGNRTNTCLSGMRQLTSEMSSVGVYRSC